MFGGISDCLYSTLVNLRPGWYIVVNNATNSPVPGQYGNAFIAPMKASNRVFAVAAFDDGSVWFMYGAGTTHWVRV